MGRNLPELSPRERREAPWNDDSPDPNIGCPDEECGWYGSTEMYWSNHGKPPKNCPDCGKELEEI